MREAYKGHRDNQRRDQTMTERTQIPAYTDRWMMGDRYGDLIRVSTSHTSDRFQIAHIKLDISGKTVRVILDDCTVA